MTAAHLKVGGRRALNHTAEDIKDRLRPGGLGHVIHGMTGPKLGGKLGRKRSPCRVNAVRPEAMQPSCVPDNDRQGDRLGSSRAATLTLVDSGHADV